MQAFSNISTRIYKGFMMRNRIAVILSFLVLSTGAFASKARLEALGQDAGGSMFIDDARDVILNPAMLNFHKDFATFEWGNTTQVDDTATTPRSEGGLFKTAGNMIYGFYFGEESDDINSLRGNAGVNTEENNTSFYVGGDAGIQWGTKFTYNSFKDKQDNNDEESDVLRATLGIISGDVESFFKMGFTNSAKNVSNKLEVKTDFDLGITYNVGNRDYMVQVKSVSAEDAVAAEYTTQYVAFGSARTMKLNDKATIWTSAWYKMITTNNDIDATGESKSSSIPLSIALEVAAKDWLTLRGSVTSNLYGLSENDAGDEATIPDTTIVVAGASLTWDDLSIDGTIGNNSATTTTGVSTATGNGTLRTDTLMSRVSMTYKF